MNKLGDNIELDPIHRKPRIDVISNVCEISHKSFRDPSSLRSVGMTNTENYLQLYVNNFFILKVLLAEVVADINNLAAVLELLCLGSHVATFEADDAVGQGIELLV